MKTFNAAQMKKELPWAAPGQPFADMYWLIAIGELLIGPGMLLPAATGVLPFLTGLAALAGAFIQFVAAFFVHLPAKEYGVLGLNVLVLVLCLYVFRSRGFN